MIAGVRVLVADDNEGLRSTTAMILESVGCMVVQAEDGTVALEKLASQPIDVVVLDVRMPNCDGIGVLETLTPAPPPPVVVLDSAYHIDHELRDRLGSKVFKYLRKPVRPNDLIDAVTAAADLLKSEQG
ncbi:MAG: response regulator [Acidimicrobiales bacterium]